MTHSHSVIDQARDMTKKYLAHARRARARGIAWEFTFDSWRGVWVASGKWNLRAKGGFVMCRNGDVGPYAPWNVRIDTQSSNSKEFWDANPEPRREYKAGLGRGWVLDKRCRTKPYVARFRRREIGRFATPEEAHAAYLAAANSSQAESTK